MSTADILENIRHKALTNQAFRNAILKTKSSKEPISDFCRLCRENGFELYEMELITFGEAEYAAMKRSTNGGGENSPMMEGQDDIYEMLLLELEALK
jgi:hypothetical protein